MSRDPKGHRSRSGYFKA